MKIERAILGCFDEPMTRMKTHREAGVTLLDHTMTLLGSNLGNAAAHDPRNNPIILAGGGLILFAVGLYFLMETKVTHLPLLLIMFAAGAGLLARANLTPKRNAGRPESDELFP